MGLNSRWSRSGSGCRGAGPDGPDGPDGPEMVQIDLALVVELSPAGPSGRLALARSGEQNSVKPPAAAEPQLDRRV